MDVRCLHFCTTIYISGKLRFILQGLALSKANIQDNNLEPRELSYPLLHKLNWVIHYSLYRRQ